MITIYEDKKYVEKKDRKRVVECVDKYFRDNFVGKIEPNEKDKEYMGFLDSAKYLGKGRVDIVNGTRLEDLSPSCKMLMVLNHSRELGNPIINVNECINKRRCCEASKTNTGYDKDRIDRFVRYLLRMKEIEIIKSTDISYFGYSKYSYYEREKYYKYVGREGIWITEYMTIIFL